MIIALAIIGSLCVACTAFLVLVCVLPKVWHGRRGYDVVTEPWLDTRVCMEWSDTDSSYRVTETRPQYYRRLAPGEWVEFEPTRFAHLDDGDAIARRDETTVIAGLTEEGTIAWKP
jgi:hypothetical protein